MSDKTTKIVSFRVPAELIDRLDEKAQKEEKTRTEWLKDIFIPIIEAPVNTGSDTRPKNI